MIRGTVRDKLELVVPITVLAADGSSARLDALLDTGFTEFLALPPRIVASLGLRRLGLTDLLLADGSAIVDDVYVGAIDWDGEALAVPISSIETTPLVGMKLLDECKVTFRVVEGGEVTITPVG